MNPNLSVIVPVYNVEPYIRRCLDSLVNQTYHDMEIIVIDDGSPDNCGVICDEYAAKYPQLRVIHQENAGVGAARNTGLDEATGKWITFVDSDDWVETDYCESMLRALGNREVDIFCANGCVVEYEGRHIPMYNAYQDFDYHDREHLDILMAQVLTPRCLELCQAPTDSRCAKHLTSRSVVWDNFYRSDFLRNHQLRFYSQNRKVFWDDMLFNYLAFHVAERIAGCNVFKYHYFQHSVSYMHRYKPGVLNTKDEFRDAICKAVPETMENPLLREAMCACSIAGMAFIMEHRYLHPSNPDSRSVRKKRIREMTRMPYFHEALYESSGRFLNKRQLVLKYLLRQPFLWPLELVVKGNAWLKRR